MENIDGNKIYLETLEKYSSVITRFEKQREKIHRLWNIDALTAEFLFKLIIDFAPRRILEIGTSNGYSTFWLANAANCSDAIVETIEVDQARYDLSKNNLQNFDNIIQHLGLAENIIPTINHKYDLIFIDAGKIGYIKYIQAILPKLTDQALIIADNVISHQKTVQEYLDYIDSNQHFENRLINIGTGLMISNYSK